MTHYFKEWTTPSSAFKIHILPLQSFHASNRFPDTTVPRKKIKAKLSTPKEQLFRESRMK